MTLSTYEQVKDKVLVRLDLSPEQTAAVVEHLAQYADEAMLRAADRLYERCWLNSDAGLRNETNWGEALSVAFGLDWTDGGWRFVQPPGTGYREGVNYSENRHRRALNGDYGSDVAGVPPFRWQADAPEWCQVGAVLGARQTEENTPVGREIGPRDGVTINQCDCGEERDENGLCTDGCDNCGDCSAILDDGVCPNACADCGDGTHVDEHSGTCPNACGGCGYHDDGCECDDDDDDSDG